MRHKLKREHKSRKPSTSLTLNSPWTLNGTWSAKTCLRGLVKPSRKTTCNTGWIWAKVIVLKEQKRQPPQEKERMKNWEADRRKRDQPKFKAWEKHHIPECSPSYKEINNWLPKGKASNFHAASKDNTSGNMATTPSTEVKISRLPWSWAKNSSTVAQKGKMRVKWTWDLWISTAGAPENKSNCT